MELATFIYPLIITLFFTALSGSVYYRIFLKRDVAIATVFFGVLVFCIVYFVSFEDNIGLGIGLLGILSLIRLRSTPENLIDISYIFYSITIGLINTSLENVPMMLLVDAILTTILALLSSQIIFQKKINTINIVIDDLNFNLLGNRTEVTKKISEEYELKVKNWEIIKVNRLKDTVTIKVIYEE